MSVRSFHSVFMASAVAGAALGCYLVSLRVASERAALEDVETQIVMAQRDLRSLQTEIGTRGRLAQLERWNVRVLALSAPSADQILGDKFQLARMIAPEHKRDIEAPIVLASAPAPERAQPLSAPVVSEVQPAGAAQLMHEASFNVPEPRQGAREIKLPPPQPKPAKPATVVAGAAKSEKQRFAAVTGAMAKVAAQRIAESAQKTGDKSPRGASAALTKAVRTAKVDPLAPLPSSHSTAKGSRTEK